MVYIAAISYKKTASLLSQRKDKIRFHSQPATLSSDEFEVFLYTLR